MNYGKEESVPCRYCGVHGAHFCTGDKTWILKQTKIMNEPETFDWLTAMKLFAEGVEIEGRVKGYSDEAWVTYYNDHAHATFSNNCEYRRKPTPPAPDYTKDQGFKEGDIVMLSDYGEDWHINDYVTYNEGHVAGTGLTWTLARPLTKEEYARVRHEGEALNNNSK
jgi:hypothetical protein